MINSLDEFFAQQRTELIQQMREIFFEASSVKTFKDQQHRDDFFQRWCGVYLGEGFPSPLVALQDDQILGYLIYSLTSPLPEPFAQPGVECFQDMYSEFPAHLHMNCRETARGRGIGRALVNKLSEILEVENVDGVHIITSPDQANVKFYRKLNFDCEKPREFKGYPLLFMGKKISRSGGERENLTSRSL